jgi:F420 biosynthesis protein FbiB-like protein
MTELSGSIGDDANGWRQSDRPRQSEDASGTGPQGVNDEWFWELIRGRRSVRRYRPDPIARPLLEKLLTAAIWAPSAHNRQPWRFCVVTSDLVKQELSDRMGARWRADLSADGVDAALIERRVRISHARITGAPALVAASVSLEEMDDYPDERRQEAEWLMAVQSTALACQNLLLAAHQYGLAACWMCAPLFVSDLVRDALALPDSWHPQALITLGYAAEEKKKERLPLAERVLWR